MKKLLLLFIFIVILTFSSCLFDIPTTISVDKSFITLTPDETGTFSTQVYNQNNFLMLNAEIFWSSNDPDIATVNDGTVTAISYGTTQVVARCGDAFYIFTIVVAEDSDIYDLSVALQPQQTEVWCWAACIQMVFNNYGVFYSQSQIVSYVYGYPMTNPASDYQMQYTLLYMGGINSSLYTGMLSLDQIKLEIDNGQPIILKYSSSFIGHVVTVFGFDIYNNLYIHDPYFGTFVVPYAQTFTYGGNMYCSGAFHNLYPADKIRNKTTEPTTNMYKDEERTILIF